MTTCSELIAWLSRYPGNTRVAIDECGMSLQIINGPGAGAYNEIGCIPDEGANLCPECNEGFVELCQADPCAGGTEYWCCSMCASSFPREQFQAQWQRGMELS